ncbi:MAG: caspase family protein [Acidobacteriota bacterium]
MTRRRALLVGIDRYPLLGERHALRGCRRDVSLMRALLVKRGFEPEVLLDDAATREAILAAMRRLLEDARHDDLLTVYFSGHGSQRQVGCGQDARYEETIVPVDSGRGGADGRASAAPNRDIVDDELRRWLRLVTPRIDHVTLIFDCCHSGSILRDDDAARARQIPDERRPGRLAPVVWEVDEDVPSTSPIENRYTLFAACRPRELAYEMADVGHGALTFFFARALERASASASCRELFETLCPWVTSRFPSQHPVREGTLDRRPFGSPVTAPMAFFPVLPQRGGRGADRVEIAVGIVHGVRPGSRFRIFPPGTRARHETGPLADAVLTTAGSVVSSAELNERVNLRHGTVPGGARAVLDAFAPDDPQARLLLGESLREHALGRSISDRIETSPWLVTTTDPQVARVRLHRLEPRSRSGDPLPHLGPIPRPLLAATGGDGDLVLPLIEHSEAEDGVAIERLVTNLETLARAWNLLAIENPRPGPLDAAIDVVVEVRDGDGWRRGESSADIPMACKPGDRLGLTIVNRSSRAAFPWVLDIGLTGRVSLLFPPPGAYEPLAPGARLELGYEVDKPPIVLSLPDGLPFDAQLGREPGTSRRTETLRIVCTTQPTDLSFLRQDGYRLQSRPGRRRRSVEQLVWTAWTGGEAHRLVRCRPIREADEDDDAWTVVTRSFEVAF